MDNSILNLNHLSREYKKLYNILPETNRNEIQIFETNLSKYSILELLHKINKLITLLQKEN